MEPDVSCISRPRAVQEHRPATEVFLLNFGGPRSAEEVEPFLAKIFEDPFIIRVPLGGPLRRFLARRIARQRTPETVRQYEAIGYSPINVYTERQAAHLQQELRTLHPNTRVRVINRYTSPFASDVLPQVDVTCKRLFLLPLYPQFCHSTTSSSIRDTDQAIRAVIQPSVTSVAQIVSWWRNTMFLDYSWRLLAETLQPVMGPDRQIHVVFSAHGIPQSYASRGDPYPEEVRAHYHALSERGRQWVQHRGADNVQWHLSFQSRIGPVEWLRPYTTDVITSLKGDTQQHLIMVPISFISDHIETLFEMDITYKELALQSGFASYDRVRCPNDDPQLAMCFRDVLLQHGF
jgi:ferrochelatase